jgi:hypothetical protein
MLSVVKTHSGGDMRTTVTTSSTYCVRFLAGGDTDGLDTIIAETIKELLQCGPQAQAEIKLLFSELAVGEISPEVRDLTAQTISRVRGKAEAKSGFDAFLNKQPTPWIAGSAFHREPDELRTSSSFGVDTPGGCRVDLRLRLQGKRPATSKRFGSVGLLPERNFGF